MKPCDYCSGSGMLECEECDIGTQESCDYCFGAGEVECPECDGTGEDDDILD